MENKEETQVCAAREIFKKLVSQSTELVCHDYKRGYDMSVRSTKNKLLEDIVAMYNVASSKERYMSTDGSGKRSSYIALGVDYTDDGKCLPLPLEKGLDESMITQLVLSHVRGADIEVRYWNIQLDDESFKGLFGLIEVRRGRSGPAYLQKWRIDKKTGVKKDVYYTRWQATNMPLDQLTASQRNMVSQFEERYDPSCLAQVGHDVSKLGQHTFKILIINSVDENHKEEDISLLQQSLGEAPWNVVIDLDNMSRKDGLFDPVTRYMKNRQDFFPVVWSKLHQVSNNPSSVKLVANGSRAIWIFANGCVESDEGQRPQKFSQSSLKISRFLEDVFRNMDTPKPVICFSLAMSPACSTCYNDLQRVVKQVYEATYVNMGEDDLLFVSICSSPNYKDALCSHEEEEVLCAPVAQIAGTLLELYGNHVEAEMLRFPGVAGLVSLRCDEYAVMKPFITLYDVDVGDPHLDKCSEQEVDAKIRAVREGYLQGKKITPEVFQLNGQCQMYVERAVYKDVFRIIEKNIDSPSLWRRAYAEMRMYNIYHDPSAGGTTAGRYLLWKLHDRYPCLEVTSTDDNNSETIINVINTIYQRSKKPVVVMLDGTAFTENMARSLDIRWHNENIKVLTVHVQRLTVARKLDLESRGVTLQDSKSCNWHVTSKVEKSDMMGFRSLYAAISERARRPSAKKVFLFGLFAFLGEYQKLDDHIVACISDCDEGQRVIIRLACVFYKYANHTSLPLKVIAKIMNMHRCSLCEISEAIGPPSELLIPTETRDGFIPPHECVLEKVFEKISPPPSDSSNASGTSQLFCDFIEDFMTRVVHAGSSEQIACLDDLFFQLFVNRETVTEDHVNASDFSEFVASMIELQKKHQSPDAESILSNLSDALSCVPWGGHVRALYARYLMYEKRDADRSIEEMKRAIDTNRTDGTLWIIYGNLLKSKLRKLAKVGSHPEDTLDLVLDVAEQAIAAFEEGRQISGATGKNLIYSIVGEAQTRCVVLKSLFRACNKNRHHYKVRMVSHKNELIRTSETETLRILDILDLKVDLHHFDELNVALTVKKAFQVRIDLMQLAVDVEWRDRTKKLSDNETWIAPIIMRCARTQQFGEMRHWSELTTSELQYVIDNLMRWLAPEVHYRKMRGQYMDLLTAMIWIRQRPDPSRHSRYNIGLAIQFALLWSKDYREDHEAHFYLGVLKLAKALEEDVTNRDHFVDDAKASLENCRKICRDLRTTRNFRLRRFCIGRKPGLASVVPWHLAKNEGSGIDDMLRPFRARLMKNNSVKLEEVQLTARLVQRRSTDPQHVQTHQEPMVNVHLWLCHDCIMATLAENNEEGE